MTMSFEYTSFGGYGRVRCTWTSDAAGAASGTTNAIIGELIKGVTNPDGTDAPTDNYDITLADEDGLNILAGCSDDLADRDTANTESILFLITDGSAPIAMHPVVAGAITVTVAAAGDTKSGVLDLWYRKRGGV
jgi:hypothetical protein